MQPRPRQGTAAALLAPLDAVTASSGYSRATLSPAMMVFPVLTQVLTSANWGGAVGNFFTGGLNLQVEHHLFPAVSFMHCAFLRQQECQILPWACVCTLDVARGCVPRIPAYCGIMILNNMVLLVLCHTEN